MILVGEEPGLQNTEAQKRRGTNNALKDTQDSTSTSNDISSEIFDQLDSYNVEDEERTDNSHTVRDQEDTDDSSQ